MQHIELEDLHIFLRYWAGAQASTGSSSASIAVRTLLYDALNTLGANEQLCEQTYPYKLAPSGFLVSFSHTERVLAVAIAKTKLSGLGVDTETRRVGMAVARRFFSSPEIAWLNSLRCLQSSESSNQPSNQLSGSLTESLGESAMLGNSAASQHLYENPQEAAARYLWMLKEAHIKCHKLTLVAGLGAPLLDKHISQFEMARFVSASQGSNKQNIQTRLSTSMTGHSLPSVAKEQLYLNGLCAAIWRH